MELQDKKVLVVGSGKSGIGASRLLGKKGALPVLFDSNEKLDKKELMEKTGDIPGLTLWVGTLPEEVKRDISLVVISPGVPADAPFLDEYRDRNIPVWGEIELAYAFAKGKIAAITGTNGKTTTTALTGQILSAYYSSVYVVGNIGNPYTDIALDTGKESMTAAEISSFQLETIHSFRPDVSAVLNITPDHLNRHHTMECYVKTKERIAENQTGEDVCVLNYEDPYTRDFGKRCPAKVLYFSSGRELKEGIYLSGEEIYLAEYSPGDERNVRRLMNIHDMRLVGMCNVENVMAAIAICHALKVPMDIILETIRVFAPVEHRIEFVDTKGGVDYYNDSKGTNPDAAIQGIRAMTKPTVLLGGGYDKGSRYDEWIEAFEGKVKALVLTGQTQEAIAKCARAHGISNIILEDTFEEAFQACVEQAKEGDAVLLSPACASWGMFPNYEVRGKVFKELVRKMS
ncbi:UDP-N-acetylmuramoyl-L-alanine--D-glutamate ligase [Parablautia intestinalis]|uniref:UDP-N-acetylmuramoylalanine--D-glutamate ligase n=1 Tax=Parablautia intestinalis TaxID=2320100 RepID=A0A3A9AFU9_9FIRM|nr:UDP-N-acetylmuramoyl-L-alanine--D-glutamate ligase [Parablautia intestinalis]RKI90158.1 UDP-N-acetylmuramoyl-L-alanine--D-glutamate ligase [Parablautia intestinalis]